MNITNMKVGTRLAAGFASVCFFLLIIIVIGISKLAALNGGTSSIVHERLPTFSMSTEILTQTDRIAIALRNMMLNENQEDRQKQIDEIQAARKTTTDAIEKMEKVIRLPRDKELLQQVLKARVQYDAGADKLLALIKEEKAQEARAYLASELRPVLKSYKEGVNNLIRLQEELIETAGKEASDNFAQARTLMISLGAVAVLLAASIGFAIARNLLKQLGGEPAYAAAIAGRIAAGDLTVEVDIRRDDRSSMLHAMHAMRDSLANIVAQVRQGTDAIATASGQIAAGNLDLSSRTEEQASSLEETASSMEELTSTVKQNADNARQANQLAVSASAVAEKGGAVVSQVVRTMGSINESSKKIVDIIGVIDGIAFQTNILALNAAVEAARAGEQGRGFAVVASEVRNLAQRSASAAKEIKTLIGDSVDKVAEGSKLVDEAGATMQEVVESVKRVNDIMHEITAASQEQTAGIEQINQAITQMDQVTQQNASLVEEAAAASDAMQGQARNLAQVVGVFTIGGAQTAAKAQAPTTAVAPRAAGKRRPASGIAVAAPRRKSASPAPTAAGDDWETF